MRYVGDEDRVAYNGATIIDPINSVLRSRLSVHILQGISQHGLSSARRNDGASC